MHFDIRTAGLSEWKQIRDFRIEAVSVEPNAFGQTRVEELALSEDDWNERMTSGRCYVALGNDDAYLGMLFVKPDKRAKFRHTAKIYGVYVTPAARGQGIARALMTAAIRDSERDGTIVLSLTVAETQAQARALYEKMGFRTIGVQERNIYIHDRYINSYVMEKVLH